MPLFATQGFWNRGPEQYLKALRKEEQEQLQPLRDALGREPDPEVAKDLKDQIKAVEAEFKQKRKAADSGLFMTR